MKNTSDARKELRKAKKIIDEQDKEAKLLCAKLGWQHEKINEMQAAIKALYKANTRANDMYTAPSALDADTLKNVERNFLSINATRTVATSTNEDFEFASEMDVFR